MLNHATFRGGQYEGIDPSIVMQLVSGNNGLSDAKKHRMLKMMARSYQRPISLRNKQRLRLHQKHFRRIG